MENRKRGIREIGTLSWAFFQWALLGAVWCAALVLLGQFMGGFIVIPIGLGAAVFFALAWKGQLRQMLVLAAGTAAMAACYYFFLSPSNDRDWELEMERLPEIYLTGDQMEVFNLRDFHWLSSSKCEARWRFQKFDLSRLDRLELMVEPFDEMGLAAHVFLRFGFSDGKRLLVSVEARRERGERYGLLAGAARQFELIYIFATEEDVLNLRTVHRESNVYAYPLRVDKAFMRDLLQDLGESANALHEQPQFYATLRDNCTTTLLKHANALTDGSVGGGYEIIFPAKVGALVHRLGLMDTNLSYEDAKAKFRVDRGQ